MRFLLAFILALVVCGAAAGAIGIAEDAKAPSLRLDALGNGEVSWTQGGARHTLLVPKTGRVLPGGHLPGADASKPASLPIPFKRVVRRAPDGWLWSLQRWPVVPGGPDELRIARWRGPLPKLTLVLEDGNTLTGTATQDGRPVSRYSRSFAGQRPRVFVYLDALVAGKWQRIGGVPPAPDGSFRRFVPQELQTASRFRAILTGPAVGRAIAPDVLATATP